LQAAIVMASTGNEDRTAVHDVSLHPYVKLAIIYMGLMIAFVIVGLVYYSVNLAYDPAEVASLLYAAYYTALLAILGATIACLANRKRTGAYIPCVCCSCHFAVALHSRSAGKLWHTVGCCHHAASAAHVHRSFAIKSSQDFGVVIVDQSAQNPRVMTYCLSAS
jgi:hypothetical protein